MSSLSLNVDNFTNSGTITISNTTDSTSSNNGGSATFLGGMAVAKQLIVGTIVTASSFSSTVSTGTSPFTISSTTNVANLNASSLSGNTFGNPGSIGSTIPGSAVFTTITSSGINTLNNTTSSSSSSTGALVLSSGSLAVGNTTDATSSTNGGSASLAGGLAVAKKLIVGTSVSSPFLISTVATGTAPFTITSTTNVANLNASSLSGNTFASPGSIGSTTPGSASFTTISASGVFTSTVTTGTAPFTISSTTNVANLNASSLSGNTFASPGSIGSTTPGSGNFTTISASGIVTVSNSTGTLSGSTINAVSSATGAFNVQGDMTLYNTSSGGGIFSFAQNNFSGAPTFTTRSLGTRIVIYPAVGASSVDNAIGVSIGNMWYSINNNSGNNHIWYGGTTNIMQLNGIGVLTINGTLSSTSSSTGSLVLSSGSLAVGNTTDSSSSTNGGSATLAGGLAVAKSLIVGTSVSSPFLISTVATGTAPFTVASTTNVANLNASSLSGNTFANPGIIGGTTPGSANFTTISASGIITSTVTTGTAPFTVASTTNVANLNASSLSGNTFASPGSIGSTTPGSAAFTTISASGVTSVTNSTKIGSTINPSSATGGSFLNSGDVVLSPTSILYFAQNNSTTAPTFTNRSVGTMLVLYPSTTVSTVDYAIGISTNNIWYSTAGNSSGNNHIWYGGTTNVMQLSGIGVLTINGTIASTSSSSGSLVLSSGSLAVGNTTDSSSSTNGGSGTFAGGLAVAKSLIVGTSVSSPFLISTVATGTAPFTVASTTNVANLNASSLSGNTFASPGSIGSTTPGSAVFTTITSSGINTLNNTTSSSSSSTGALVLSSGSLAVGNTTDATSSTNGGSASLAGGLAVAKKLIVGTSVSSPFLISTISTGTAPFTVASTTNVANLNASSLSGNTFASPGSIGSTTPGSANFTTISASGVVTSTVTTGTAPFTISSTTNVANLNASSLSGNTFANPGPIGSSISDAGTFTTVSASGVVTVSNSTATLSGSTSNAVSSPTGAFNVKGDMTLYNTSSGGGIFSFARNDVTGAPTFNTRSLGTRLVLYPNIGASTVDMALGFSTTDFWFSTYGTMSWYVNTVNVLSISSSALTVSPNTSSTSSTTGSLLLSGGIGNSNTTDAVSSTNGGSASFAGGLAVAKKLIVGTSVSSPFFTSTVTTGTAPFTVASTTNVANLNASSLSGNTFASPGTIGGSVPGSGNFTTISASGVITSTVSTGTAPFTIASTTNVANLNASTLNGNTFANPGSIGSGTAATTIAASGIVTLSNTTASSSSSTGALVLSSGSLAIGNTTDAVSSSNGGCATFAGGLAVAKSSFFGDTLTISGALSGTPSVTGQYLSIPSSTFTDNNTPASGTAPNAIFNSIGIPTLAATNATVTTTTAATLFIAGPPSAGTNQTITNSYSLVVAGNSSFGGQVIANGALCIPYGNFIRTVTNTNTNMMVAAFNATVGNFTFTGADALLLYCPGNSGGSGSSPLLGLNSNVCVIAAILRISNTVTSASSTSGSIQLFGGIGINNTTDAVSSTNGGTITSDGGAAFAKSVFVGTSLNTPHVNVGYSTTVTSASTVTLTVTSTQQQFFTGSTAQTVTLPVASTLTLGFVFQIVNISTQSITVNSSGGNLVGTVLTNTRQTFTCILTSGTTAASWSNI